LLEEINHGYTEEDEKDAALKSLQAEVIWKAKFRRNICNY
jgi:methionine salvage enolase-phosphatase E1